MTKRPPVIPEGLQTKALALGYGVEARRRALAALPVLYRFSNRGRIASEWMDVAAAHNWLDYRLSAKGDRS